MKSMNAISAARSRESGVVSILVVIFFMIFVSVIVVGFIKIVNDDQSQATDSDLSASALTAAQSGAEDGKRVLMLCKTRSQANLALAAACNNALNNSSCDAVTRQAEFRRSSVLNLQTEAATGDGIVSGNSAYEQRYTCMTLATRSDSVEGVLVEKGKSELIPLTSVNGTFQSVQFSWHRTTDVSDGGNGPLRALRSNNVMLPAEDQWRNGTDRYAAAMRLEFIAYPKSGVDLNRLDQDTRTVLVLPGSNTAVPSINLNALDIRDQSAAEGIQYNPNNATAKTPQFARCQTNAEYACSVNVRLVGAGVPTPATHNYFLRVSSIYGPAYVKAQLLNDRGEIEQFNDVQPVIDVTGRANDVFRRIQTRVQYDTTNFLPEYAIEVGSLCKNMTVADTGANSLDMCNSGAVLPGSGGGDAAVTFPPSTSPPGSGPSVPCHEREGWFAARCWTYTLVNASNVVQENIDRCIWNWGDGTVNTYPGSHINCARGTSVVHNYQPLGPEGQFRYYDFVLTNIMKDGSTYHYRRDNQRLPR